MQRPGLAKVDDPNAVCGGNTRRGASKRGFFCTRPGMSKACLHFVLCNDTQQGDCDLLQGKLVVQSQS